VLDLSRLEYISSAGFRVLLLAAKLADETGSRLVLCGVSGKVRQLFDLGGFLDLSPSWSREEGNAAGLSALPRHAQAYRILTASTGAAPGVAVAPSASSSG
jgi:hypothetical protein